MLSFTLWLGAILGYIFDELTFFQALFLCSVFGYINFTPMHEASHGNITLKLKKYRPLENLIGHLSSATLFVPYPIFKPLHLQHHSFTNDPEWDPDYWVATTNPFSLFLRVFTIKLHYYYHALLKPRSVVRRERAKIFITFSVYIALIVTTEFIFEKGVELLVLWFFSAVLSLAFLALVFDWLPHTPHKRIGRYVDTVIINKSFLTYPLLYQNYHLCHHLYPRVPFYLYKELFEENELEMREKGSIIL